jgi:DNA-binding transcriptional LysR family regulator
MGTYRAPDARIGVPLGLDVFVDIVTSGSIAAAARNCGETRSTLSRRLSKLEADLGVELLSRSSRRLVPTRAGDELFRRAQRIIAEVTAAEEAIRRLDDVPRGPLRVSIPPGDSAEVVGDLFASFLNRYPQIEVEIVASDRHVDLVGEGFDAAIRAGDAGDPGLVRRIVGRHRLIAVASPAYLATDGAPASAEHLRDHRCIVGFAGTDRAVPVWPLVAGGSVRVPIHIACNNLTLQRALARAGHGLALVPALLAAADLASGVLVPVLPESVGANTTLSIVYPERRILEPQVRAFVDHAAQHLRAAVADRPSV